MNVTPPNVVTAEVPAPIEISTIPEEPPLVLMEGVAKGGYPVDITSPSTVDLTSLDQPELICASTLIEAGLEPAAAAQFEVGYPVLGVEESPSAEPEYPSSITEVIRPMEMAELVDIIPTLALIEEETPSDPSSPTMMDIVESFGLGISESDAVYDEERPDLTVVRGFESRSTSGTVTLEEDTVSRDTVTAVAEGDGRAAFTSDSPSPQDTDRPQLSTGFPLRSQVEWDRSTDSSS